VRAGPLAFWGPRSSWEPHARPVSERDRPPLVLVWGRLSDRHSARDLLVGAEATFRRGAGRPRQLQSPSHRGKATAGRPRLRAWQRPRDRSRRRGTRRGPARDPLSGRPPRSVAPGSQRPTGIVRSPYSRSSFLPTAPVDYFLDSFSTLREAPFSSKELWSSYC
jgi:hypothetical protein